MWKDPIVEEIHKIREQHAQRFDFDLIAIYNDLKVQEKKGGYKTVSLPLKRFQREKTNT